MKIYEWAEEIKRRLQEQIPLVKWDVGYDLDSLVIRGAIDINHERLFAKTMLDVLLLEDSMIDIVPIIRQHMVHSMVEEIMNWRPKGE